MEFSITVSNDQTFIIRPKIQKQLNEFEAFEHLLIYVYSLEKNVFLTRKKQKKLWNRG